MKGKIPTSCVYFYYGFPDSRELPLGLWLIACICRS